MHRFLLLAVALFGCGAPASPTGPTTALVSDTSVPASPPAASSAAPPAAGGPCDPSASFAEVVDDSGTVRLERGRELVPGRRGSVHAYAEEVIHGKGSVVFALEALGAEGKGGTLAISVTHFAEPTSLPASLKGRVSYLPVGKSGERDERVMDDASIELTEMGAVGQWVTGTFSAPSMISGRGNTSMPAAKGQFRVCRTADWKSDK